MDTNAYSAKMSRFTLSSHTQPVASASTWEDILIGLNNLLEKPPESAWWLDIRDPTEEDVNDVAQGLSIHPLTVEDIVTREPREKVEVFRNYYLISFQTLVSFSESEDDAYSEGSKTPSSAVFYILVFTNGTVTFSPSGCGHVRRVRDRVRRLYDPSILSSDWICYALMYSSLPLSLHVRSLITHSDDIVDSFAPYMQSASRESEAIEDQVFIARVDDARTLIPRVDILRKKITHLIRCLNGKLDVLNGFVKRCQAKDKHPVFPDGDLILYLGDVQDHLITTMSNLAHFDEIVGRSQANCLAQLSATNLRLSLNINEVMSKVTVLATIFVPLHLVTGLFGMNVEVPGQENKGLAWFFGIVGFFVAFMVLACAVAWRYKLL